MLSRLKEKKQQNKKEDPICINLFKNFFILIVIYHGIKRLIKSVRDKRDPPKNEPFDVAT